MDEVPAHLNPTLSLYTDSLWTTFSLKRSKCYMSYHSDGVQLKSYDHAYKYQETLK